MSAENQIGFGICGLGFMGRQYFSHLREHPRARVVAVCDRDKRRRDGDWSDSVGNLAACGGERVDMSDVATYADWEALVSDGSVDAVAITLPTSMHADLAVAALEAGKHVLCEKPMALTLEECDRMIVVAQRSGRTLMIAQCIRFWPQYEEIKRRIDAGEIGAVRFASLRRLANAPDYSAGGWLMDASQSGGALFDLHVHDADFAQYLFGTPAAVTALGSRGPSGGYDHLVANWSYADGRYLTIEGGWVYSAPWPFEMAITVVGENGTLDWSMRRGPAVHHYRGGDEPELITVSDQTGWPRELDYFVDALQSSTPVDRCPPTSSRDAIALVLTERKSIEQGGARLRTPGSPLRESDIC